MSKFNSLKERIEKNFKENKVFLFVFLVVWIIAVVFTNNHYKATIGKTSLGNDVYDRSVVEINKNTNIKATIPVEEDTNGISILFATYARNNSGNITIIVKDSSSNNEYINKTVDVNGVQDNAYLTLESSEIIKGNSKIDICITSTSDEGQGIGLYYSNSKCFENSTLVINDNELENCDISLRYLTNNDLLKSFSNIYVTSFITCITLLALIYLLINPKTHVMFALCVFVLGLFMMIAIVPSSPPDELSHYEVALQLSNEIMGQDVKTIDSVYLKYGYMYGHYNISAGYVRLMNELFKPLKLTGKMSSLSRDVFSTYWVQYIPNAIGLTIGRLLKCNMITTFYLGRLANLIFYVVCIYFAIKKTPSFKYIFGILAILPMFLQTASSISYDTFILGLSFLIISYFTSFYFTKDKIKTIDLIIVIVLCNLIAPAKVVYGLFAFLFIFIPYKKFGSKLKKTIIVLLISVSTIYQLYDIMYGPIRLFINSILKVDNKNALEMKIENNVLSTNSTLIASKEPEQFSFKYMIKHPLETLDIFYRTVRYRIKFWFYGSLGRSLSGDTLIIPLGLVYSLIASVILASLVKQEHTFGIGLKVTFIVMCVIIGLFIMIGMFVSWTDGSQIIVADFGGIIIEGIQGRYFDPILSYFFVCIPNKKISLPTKANKYILLGYLIIFFEVIMYVLSYTFVN